MQKMVPSNGVEKPVPLYLQIRNHLIERIAAGEWKVGQPMPNEADLARSLGFSAGTIRKALDLMEQEQMVCRRQGRGTFVTGTTPAKVCQSCGHTHDILMTALREIATRNNAFLTDGSEATRQCLEWCVETARAALAKVEAAP
jgi:DNA-binding GntR family transcriptional regulator